MSRRGNGELGAQQHRRCGVEVAAGEHAAIGFHHEGGVGQCDVDEHGVGRRVGLIVEVVARVGLGVGLGVELGVGLTGGPVTVGGHSRSLAEMSYTIRTYGDPVLKTRASMVDDVDGKIIRLVDAMFDTLVDSGNGIALAAPQIGVQKQVVVWDIDENPLAIINPEVVESDGEWVYDEGCLSIPGLYVEMLRPKTVLVRGIDINGEIIEIEADELEARMFQHEIDHLNGVLMFDRLEGDQRKEAIKEYRRIEDEATREAARNPIRRRLGLG